MGFGLQFAAPARNAGGDQCSMYSSVINTHSSTLLLFQSVMLPIISDIRTVKLELNFDQGGMFEE
jgi:hypothetical protein